MPHELALSESLVTFLFTDIEDSTGQWHRLPETMRHANALHDTVMREAIERHGGTLFRTAGDAFYVAFDRPYHALLTAFDVQRDLPRRLEENDYLPLRVRMAIHSGMVERRDGDYYGLAPAMVARLLEVVQGGQVLLTETSQKLVAPLLLHHAELLDLGEHHLRGFPDPVRLFQLLHPELPVELFPPRSTLDIPNNLQRPVTPFIGRAKEIGELRHLVLTRPLVSLVDPGGCGKTRLALQLSRYVSSLFPDGIFFIDLVPLRSGTELPRRIIDALKLGLTKDADEISYLVDYLRSKRFLLILDNCEHLIDDITPMVERLLQDTDSLHLLVTSRQALGLYGENIFAVTPLSVPPEDVPPTAKDLLPFEAVSLFTERLTATRTAFRLDDKNAPLVARICRHLEGIPLALIIVAAWATTLPLSELQQQITHHLPLTRSGPRMPLTHHQTLFATVDWSYSRLEEAEQNLFRRLAVFVGGWTREAASEVCGDGLPNVDILLDSLVSKSLVLIEEEGEQVRFRFLEVIRQYGAEKLTLAGEAELLEQRHRAYFVAWAAQIGPELYGPNSRVEMLRVDYELGNLRAALSTTHEAATGLTFIAGLFWYWHTRGYVLEGLRYADRFFRLAEEPGQTVPSPPILAKAHNGTGILAWFKGDYPLAIRHFQAALEINRRLADLTGIATNLSNLGQVLSLDGDHVQAEERLREAYDLWEQLGNRSRVGTVLTNLSSVACRAENYEKAYAFRQQAQVLYEQSNDSHALASLYHDFTDLCIRMDRFDEAREHLRKAIQLRLEMQNRPGLANCFDLLAELVERSGGADTAVRLLGFTLHYREQIETPRDRNNVAMLEALRKRLEEKISSNVLAEQEMLGRHMKVEEAIQLGFACLSA